MFYPIKYGRSPIESCYAEDLSDYPPPGFLPFANSGSGDLFCLDMKNNNVVIWYEEGKMEKLTDTFQEFIDGLMVEEESGEDDD